MTDTGESAERWLSIDQAGVAAGVSRRTIYNWLLGGKLVSKRTAGGAQRILESSLWRVGEVQAPVVLP